jgi:hypothetical protein
MAKSCTAKEALQQVPDKPGYYAIFVDGPLAFGEVDPLAFAEVFSKVFSTRIPTSGLIYIGIASDSLLFRLVHQDLKHEDPSSFFATR